MEHGPFTDYLLIQKGDFPHVKLPDSKPKFWLVEVSIWDKNMVGKLAKCFFCLGRGLVGLGVLKPGGNQSSNAPFAKLCGVLVWQISGQGEYMSLQEVSRGLRCLWLKATCSPGWWFQMFSRYMFHRMEWFPMTFSAVPGFWVRDPGNLTVAVWEPRTFMSCLQISENGLLQNLMYGFPKKLGTPRYPRFQDHVPYSNCNSWGKISFLNPQWGWWTRGWCHGPWSKLDHFRTKADGHPPIHGDWYSIRNPWWWLLLCTETNWATFFFQMMEFRLRRNSHHSCVGYSAWCVGFA